MSPSFSPGLPSHAVAFAACMLLMSRAIAAGPVPQNYTVLSTPHSAPTPLADPAHLCYQSVAQRLASGSMFAGVWHPDAGDWVLCTQLLPKFGEKTRYCRFKSDAVLTLDTTVPMGVLQPPQGGSIFPVDYGVCLPSNCSSATYLSLVKSPTYATALTAAANSAIAALGLTDVLPATAVTTWVGSITTGTSKITCHDEREAPGAGFYLTSSLIILLSLLCALSSCEGLFHEAKKSACTGPLHRYVCSRVTRRWKKWRKKRWGRKKAASSLEDPLVAPPPPPSGEQWFEAVDPESGATYLYNASGQTRWQAEAVSTDQFFEAVDHGTGNVYRYLLLNKHGELVSPSSERDGDAAPMQQGYAPRQSLVPGFRTWLSMTFSCQHNTSRLFAPQKGKFLSLNGIRVLSMAYVIVGHTWLLGMEPAMYEPLEWGFFTTQASFLPLHASFFAVDSFFFMSGFLGAWKFLGDIDKKGFRLKRVGLAYVARFLRLTPSYAFVLLFYITVLPHLGDGPYWTEFQQSLTSSTSACAEYWWTNLLYINNFVPWATFAHEKWDTHGGGIGCMGWTWYMANDFQFFIGLPFFCFLLHKFPRSYGPAAIAFSVIVQIIVTGAEYSGRTIFAAPGAQSEVLAAHWVYTKPWCRIAPYVLGIAVAHGFRCFEAARKAEKKREVEETKGDDKSPTTSRAGQGWARPEVMVAALCMAGTVLTAVVVGYFSQIDCPRTNPACGYGLLSPGNWGSSSEPGWRAAGVLYMMLTPLAWTAGLATLAVACFLGWGSFVRRFLELPFWTPLARLTYNAYLTHMCLILGFNNSERHASEYAPQTMVWKAVANVVLSYGVAFPVYLLVEKPMMNIAATLLFPRRAARGPATPPEQEQEKTEGAAVVTPPTVHQQGEAGEDEGKGAG